VRAFERSRVRRGDNECQCRFLNEINKLRG